jgi:aryl-alcohol dehydrogenase-like predicted oxidoreductase
MNERRRIGTSDLLVSPVCLGGNVFGWSADEEMSFAVLDAYAAAGGNFIDTANIYSAWVPGNRGGESEEILGRWMRSRGNRDELVLATKVGMAGGPDQPAGLTRDAIRRGVHESLERLGTDRIDLYFAHIDDPDTPLAETMAAFDELVRAGTIRAVGASQYSAARLAEALDVSAAAGVARFEALQIHYNLMERREYEEDLIEVCGPAGIAVLPFFALARGFLTGKYRPGEQLPSTPRAAGVARDYLNDRGWAVLAAMDAVAAARDAALGQIALAWLLARPGVAAPVASATSPVQVAELAAAADLRLTDEEIAGLDAASAW